MCTGSIINRRMKIYVEIKAAEGGNDAKLFVTDYYDIYQKWMIKHCL